MDEFRLELEDWVRAVHESSGAGRFDFWLVCDFFTPRNLSWISLYYANTNKQQAQRPRYRTPRPIYLIPRIVQEEPQVLHQTQKAREHEPEHEKEHESEQEKETNRKQNNKTKTKESQINNNKDKRGKKTRTPRRGGKTKATAPTSTAAGRTGFGQDQNNIDTCRPDWGGQDQGQAGGKHDSKNRQYHVIRNDYNNMTYERQY